MISDGHILAYDVHVISPHSAEYDGNALQRLYPITVGNDETAYYNYDVARDDGAAVHIARFKKVRVDYSTAQGKPTHDHYLPNEPGKDVLPEERRLLKPFIFRDPLRGEIRLLPLVFSVGGAVSPETWDFLRAITNAQVDATPDPQRFQYTTVFDHLCSSLSSHLMRSAA
jgi:hypothetical protein